MICPARALPRRAKVALLSLVCVTMSSAASAAPEFPYASDWVGGRYERPEVWVSGAGAIGVKTPGFDEVYGLPTPTAPVASGMDLRIHLSPRWETALAARFVTSSTTATRTLDGGIGAKYEVRSTLSESSWFVGAHREWFGTEHFALIAGPQIGFLPWRMVSEDGLSEDRSERRGTDFGVAVHARASAFIADRLEVGPAVRLEGALGSDQPFSLRPELTLMVGVHY